jgi:hypothetical protein
MREKMKIVIRLLAFILFASAVGVFVLHIFPEPEIIYKYIEVPVVVTDKPETDYTVPRPPLVAERLTPYVMPYDYVYALEDMLLRFGGNLSVFYKNMETGFRFVHNENEVFFSASVPKAFFSLYIYLMAERGEVDLDGLLTYTNADYHGGSGVINTRYAPGTQFTRRELLRLNLSYSDNIATNILRREHGILGYRQFVMEIGGNPNHVQNFIFNSLLTIGDAGLMATEIFNYIESGGRYSEEFRAHLLNNQYPFIVSNHPIASKTGWSRPSAWHDMAIVYSPSPYILTILSRRDGWTERDYEDFYEISMAFEEFNDKWFVLYSEALPGEVTGAEANGYPTEPGDKIETGYGEENGGGNGETRANENDGENGEEYEGENEGESDRENEDENVTPPVIPAATLWLTVSAVVLFFISFKIKKEEIIILEGTGICCDYYQIIKNNKKYMGKKIQMEGAFTTENVRNHITAHMVSQDVTTACGKKDTLFFELEMGDNPLPEQDERVRVTGTLHEYEQRGRKNTSLLVKKINIIKKRGKRR